MLVPRLTRLNLMLNWLVLMLTWLNQMLQWLLWLLTWMNMLDAQGDLFLEEVFLLRVFLFKTKFFFGGN
jgi:hypothetical protein